MQDEKKKWRAEGREEARRKKKYNRGPRADRDKAGIGAYIYIIVFYIY